MIRLSPRVRAAWNEFFFRPSDGKALSALRIVLALGMLCEAIAVLPYIDGLYGPMGFLQSRLVDFLTGATIPGLAMNYGVSPSSYLNFLHFFYAAHLALLVFLALGWQTRWMAVFVWLTKAFLVNSGNYSSYGVDSYFHNLIFLLMLFPAGKHWSVDRRQGRSHGAPESSCTFGLRMIQIFVLMTYVNAGVGKGIGAQWWTGEAIWESLNLPEFSHFGNFSWMAAVPLVPRLLGVFTVFLETFYFAGVWFPRVGRAWVLAIAGMHLGIALFMGMWEFGISLAAVNVVVFLKPWTWASSLGPDRARWGEGLRREEKDLIARAGATARF